MKRLRLGTVISHPDKESILKEHPGEYDLAKKIKVSLEEKLGISIPEDEVAYLAMFLYAVKAGKGRGNIGVLVIAHGDAAARWLTPCWELIMPGPWICPWKKRLK